MLTDAPAVAVFGSVAVTVGWAWLLTPVSSVPPPHPDTEASSVNAAPAIQNLVLFMKEFLTEPAHRPVKYLKLRLSGQRVS
jgi:hypothetical protein